MFSSRSLPLFLLLAACSGDTARPAATPPPPATRTAPVAAPPVATGPAPCKADSSWLTATTGPTEIGNNTPVGQETNCEFQQFSWQWFLVLMQQGTNGERAFEAWPTWLGTKIKHQCDLPKLTGRAAFAKALFMRDAEDRKASDASSFLPTEKGQATGGLLYDQEKNIVLYNVRYSPNECEATDAGFQPDTVEIKTSWRVVTNVKGFDASRYYTFQTTVAGLKGKQTLALVGFHVVVNTPKHPEFVWATFEHKDNAPDCTKPQDAPAGGWSFTSAAAAQCLKTQGLPACGQYTFNAEAAGSKGDPISMTGTPDEVCRVYPDGTDPDAKTGSNDNDTNRFNIDQLNAQLVGPTGLLTQLPTTSPLAVLRNYEFVGSLWTAGGTASAGPGVQRGSLELANLTMETNFQIAGNNCFTCHNYVPDSSSDPSSALAVSHIYDDYLAPKSASAETHLGARATEKGKPVVKGHAVPKGKGAPQGKAGPKGKVVPKRK